MERALGQRLQQELIRNNMKQRELADKVGVTEVSMSRYINGTRTPRRPILVEIARVLNTTHEYLTGTEGLDHPDEAYAKTRIAIKTNGMKWTYEQKKELINELLDMIQNRSIGNNRDYRS